MAKLRIQRQEFVLALTSGVDPSEAAWYLDSETGRLLLAGSEMPDDELPEDLEVNPRYQMIDPIASHDSFRIMEGFVASLDDDKLAARLQRALDGRKPFRHFKDVLLDFPAAREAWHRFEEQAHARLADQWCEENGIEVEWM